MSDSDSGNDPTYEDYRPQATGAPPVEVPRDALSAHALNGVIDNFVMREGTDYGSDEVSYEAKLERVKRQIDKGDIKIVFDPDSETVTLVTKTEFKRMGAVEAAP